MCDIFLVFAQNICCSMYLRVPSIYVLEQLNKNNVYLVNYKVGSKGYKSHGHASMM